MTRIGLTGGIACGKSTVTNYLRQQNYYVIDADVVSREIVQAPSKTLAAIQKAFGDDILLETGELNRRRLGDEVFGNPAALQTLNEIMFPAIWQRINELFSSYEKGREAKPLAFVDAAILFESKGEQYIDRSWLVICSQEQQMQRLMKRDNFTKEQARKRIESQWHLEEKKKRADVCLYNTGKVEELEKQVKHALQDEEER